MSEIINNSELRKETIKSILEKLHKGSSIEEVKEEFERTFNGVTPSEISEAEQALIAEGMEVSEIQKLCDVHAAVFKGSVLDIHNTENLEKIQGHPVYALKLENRELERIIDERIIPKLKTMEEEDGISELKEALRELGKLNLHYIKKENIIFPLLESHGIEAPPKVMWGVDDEIRAFWKRILMEDNNLIIDLKTFEENIISLCDKVKEMIFKEENILVPMLAEKLTEEEWRSIDAESRELGFIVDEMPEWKRSLNLSSSTSSSHETVKEELTSGIITTPTGTFTPQELVAVLNALPFDITFVDKDDRVKYFSEGKERMFTRTKSAIGRKVSNCHPPASVHIVEAIVEDLRSGRKDHEDFWIRLGDKFALIRYFAVRDEKGEYLGVLEITQDIKPIQEIEGEKRLASK
ncbi:DUF438 domain-containing protein [Alloiococcus sp. CFN-8]|uniref:DUF438 domain-containing protein n=1 Tax=Alloiococcus sp. CFN-8 TaxID=3416081 RepID=UPI003CE72C5B